MFRLINGWLALALMGALVFVSEAPSAGGEEGLVLQPANAKKAAIEVK